MMNDLALSLNMVTIAFFLAIVPFLPREKTWARSFVVSILILLWVRYLFWRCTSTMPHDIDSWLGIFFVFGLLVEIVIFFAMVVFFITLSRYSNRTPEADRHEKTLRELPPDRLPTVDVFIPTYNEGPDVLERGIVAAKAIDYPRKKIWILDDGRRDWLRTMCEEKQVGYITRPDNTHAKAGNVNHAISVTDGELFVVFDADFTPHRNFLFRTVGFFFSDPRVAIVQTPQHFFNPDVFQVNMGLSDVMQDNEREWFDVILCSRDAWDAAFCCGTSAVFRRDAIMKVGGIATESVTEDILTTVKMLPFGYVTRYLRERLSIGLAPENAKSLLIQRRRWTRGHIQLMFLMVQKYRRTLTPFQWIFFTPYFYLFDFPCRLLFLLLPLVYLWTGYAHFYVDTITELFVYQGPAVLAVFFITRWFSPHARVPFLSSAISFYISARTFPTVVSSLIKPFGVPFSVTPKGKANSGKHDDPVAIWGILTLMVFTIGGIVVGVCYPGEFHNPEGLLISISWALLNLTLLGLTLLSVSYRPRLRGEERFPVHCYGEIVWNNKSDRCRIADMSMSGAMLQDVSDLNRGDEINLMLNGVGVYPAVVVRRMGSRAGIRFHNVTSYNHDRLIEFLYTSGFCNEVQEVNPTLVLWRMIKGALQGPA